MIERSLDLDLPMQSVPIIAKVETNITIHGLRQMTYFLIVLRFPPPINLIIIVIEISLKVLLKHT